MTTKTTTKAKTATKKATKAKAATEEATLESLLLDFVALNKEANAAANKAKKARKELYIAMINAEVTSVDTGEIACDRFAKESSEIDPIKLQQHLTPEQFWKVIKIGKGDAQQFLPDAIIDTCSMTKKSNEDVHIRK